MEKANEIQRNYLPMHAWFHDITIFTNAFIRRTQISTILTQYWIYHL